MSNLSLNSIQLASLSLGARARAGVLLACMLLGPMQSVAGVILHKTLDCCATMCKMHRHGAHQAAQVEAQKSDDTDSPGMCHHESEKQAATDCSMKSCCPSDDDVMRLPVLPEIVVARSVPLPLPAASRLEAPLSCIVVSTSFVSPPDQPPRA